MPVGAKKKRERELVQGVCCNEWYSLNVSDFFFP